MIKFQNINLAVLESDIGLIVMTKNYMSVDIDEANEIVSKMFGKNEYYVDNTLRYGFMDKKTKITINPLNSYLVEDPEIKNKIMENVYNVLMENPTWINNGNLTEIEKKLFKDEIKELKGE